MAPGPGSGLLMSRDQVRCAPADPTKPTVSTVSRESSRCALKLNCCTWELRKEGVIPRRAEVAAVPCVKSGGVVTMGIPADVLRAGTSRLECGLVSYEPQ